jgi:glycosidase
MKKAILSLSILLLLLSCFTTYAQTALYPSNWWVNMKWNKVQVLVHNKNGSFKAAIASVSYLGVSISKTTHLENDHYLAIDLLIASSAKPGDVKIRLTSTGTNETLIWPLKKRREGNGTKYAQGVTSSDFMYLIMPDRFSNGDYSNDKVPGLLDQSLNRDSMYLRHGGDLQGITNHLDYLKDLGVTTVWMTPVLLNDMKNRTEHGYAITDHYTVDPRIGGSEAYKKLSDSIHAKGMKLIQDAIYNHVGLNHIIVLDKPMHDWLHEWPTFTQTSYRDQTLFDPYAAPAETKRMSDGWFVRSMPDLNQSNPYVANFLIQNALWSVEEFGVDGWRIDTYIYNDLAFMNRCNKALTDEYPHITMFGETWVHGVPNQSYFCENNIDSKFKSNLQNTTDFQQLFYGIQAAVNDTFNWTGGVNKLYNTTSQDFLYKNPMGQVIFLDNHDLSRFYSVVNEDIDKYKMALTWLLTFRGVPQLYYGDEIIMKGMSNPDGLVRSDFAGGWKEDKVNKFTAEGRTEMENEIFHLIKTLANYRQHSTAIKTGKMMQYAPENGLYVYFRYDEKETVMCIMNTSGAEKEIDITKAYRDRTQGFSSAINILTGKNEGLKFMIHAHSMLALTLKK